MIVNKVFGGSLRSSLLEVLLIVAGVLIALSVDEWRMDFEERKSIRQHLSNVVSEIDLNRWTLYNIRDRSIPRVMEQLGVVIRALDQPNPEVGDPGGFIETLIGSGNDSRPWFSRNGFDSFMSSEAFHSPHVQGVVIDISSTFEAFNVLFERRFDSGSAYADLIATLVPARFQADLNGMRGYTGDGFRAPGIVDEQPVDIAVAGIVAERERLVRLARLKASIDTAKWYAITRIIDQLEELRGVILKHPLMQDVAIPQLDADEFLKSRSLQPSGAD